MIKAAPSREPGANELLFNACRSIVMERGFAALSLRAVTKASGWTMGELAYRVGSKEQLVDRYLAHERAEANSRDSVWRERMSGVTAFDAPLLAATIEAVMDDAVINDPGAAILWHEAMLEEASGAIPAGHVAAWIADRRLHWHAMMQGRHPKAGLGTLIADFIIAEQVYSGALRADPGYRLTRSACIARLCGVNGNSGWQGWVSALPEGRGPVPTHDPVWEKGPQSRSVAEAAAQLMVEKGPSAVTHRAVAGVLGQSPSAVAHHFAARLDLMSAAFNCLFQSVHAGFHQSPRDPVAGSGLTTAIGKSSPAALGFVRAMHIIALVAVRDETFLPLLLEERQSRGRMVEAWYGEHLLGPFGTDRLLHQIISLVACVRTLASALDGGEPIFDTKDTLSEILDLVG